MWRSLVAHLVRDEGAVGSNPAIPILVASEGFKRSLSFYRARLLFCVDAVSSLDNRPPLQNRNKLAGPTGWLRLAPVGWGGVVKLVQQLDGGLNGGKATA